MTRRERHRAEDQEDFGGRLRRSQLITTFGPGSMLDLVDGAVLVSGLEKWRYGNQESHHKIRDDRLLAALRMRLPDDMELDSEAPFRLPPEGNDDDARYDSGLHVLRFPFWFVCQGARCGQLVALNGLERKATRLVHRCSRNQTGSVVPVRFVATCRRGHLQDFPWVPFVHRNFDGHCRRPRLKLFEGVAGDFSQIRVCCASCKTSTRLSSAFAPDFAFSCSGRRPWLGPDGQEECDEKIRLLVRTASHAYFPQVVSALTIRERQREIEKQVRKYWDTLQVANRDNLPSFRDIPKIREALEPYENEEVLEVVRSLQQGKTLTEPLRTAEFRQLVQQPLESPGDLPSADDDFFARESARTEDWPAEVERVVLIHKLREVRVQIGFTRLEPITADLEGEFDLGVETQRLSLSQPWLPATEVWGEGVFLQLDEETVRSWERRSAVRERAAKLEAAYEAWHRERMDRPPSEEDWKPPPFPGVRFYLLHTLAHLLLNAISLECGYAAAAIRERIYCSLPDPEEPFMAGLLLSTGTTGTEGTLGGLVEQGRRLDEHLQHALDLGRLCSNDPVCADHEPEDLDERFLEGAACHGCLYIAESSCERFNRYLDRALVVPTLGNDPEMAFFRR